MTNRPVNFNDPTGHVMDDDMQGDGDGVTDDELESLHKRTEEWKKRSRKPLIIHGGNLTSRRYLESWDGTRQIIPEDWNQLLAEIGDQVHRFSWGFKDTPFYNDHGHLSGRACLDVKCYDRSELNYIGEGEALAALGLSKPAARTVVWLWKNKTNLLMNSLTGEDGVYTFREVSQGTYEMTDIGWEYYNEHYSSPSLSVTSFLQLSDPGIGPSILIK